MNSETVGLVREKLPEILERASRARTVTSASDCAYACTLALRLADENDALAARVAALEQVAEAARDLIAADDTDDETLDAYIIRRATFEEQADAAAACDAAFNRLRDALAGLGADMQELTE